MLTLQNITKDYIMGNSCVSALRGVNISFRRNEFVSILGPSGCGKTTLLNIIGGLDRYTSGDLMINGISTKKYKDRDWDAYRNHSVGFVFQSYNLIPHQSVLSNVELALTLSGVSKKERRARAVTVLEKVGLGDQLTKRPNQLSGGQMQRVAIARALVNDPSILLADEPTGALDSETSVQIMELLKEVAEDRLVIMVTHNPELAESYSTRIIRLLDGKVIDDTMPYAEPSETVHKHSKVKKPSMSFFTALSLSLNNLLTKKARTILISFAGSIGIIGIALILSMSNGVQLLIDRMQRETLSSYPITIERTSVDLSSMMDMGSALRDDAVREENHIYSVNVMTGMMDTMLQGSKTNQLGQFKDYLESDGDSIRELTADIAYTYETPLNIYRLHPNGSYIQTNPNNLMTDLGLMPESSSTMASPMTMSLDVWSRLMDNEELLASQYDVVAGHMPENYNEVVLFVSSENEITDFSLYSLGLIDPAGLKQSLSDAAAGKETVIDTETRSYSYKDILDLEYKLLVNTDVYVQEGDKWVDKSQDDTFMMTLLNNSESIKVVGILRPAENATTGSVTGMIGYRSDLMLHLMDKVNTSPIVQAQKADPDTDVFSGLPFTTEDIKDHYTLEEFQTHVATLPPDQQGELMGYFSQLSAAGYSEEEAATKLMQSILAGAEGSYEGNLSKLGVADPEEPSAILLYPTDFQAKDQISDLIDEYNHGKDEEEKLVYTDYIGLMISSITTIINAVSYILIAFVSVSLVVSSIMIGIITYISVLERTREIGVLRSIGASKKDISRVFNAETLTIGLTAGLLGIGATIFLLWPINAIIESLTDFTNVAVLPPQAAVILILISMLLTFIAGLIPARIASKKDPVIALRSE